MPQIPNKVPSLEELKRYRQQAQSRSHSAHELNKNAKQQFRGRRPPSVSAQTRGGLAGSILSRTRPLGAGTTSRASVPSVGRPSPSSPRISFPRQFQTPKGVGAVALAYLAGAVWLHNLKEFQKLYQLSKKEPSAKAIQEPIAVAGGGQSDGVIYRLRYFTEERLYGNLYARGYTERRAYGPIRGVRGVGEGDNGYSIEILCRGVDGTAEGLKLKPLDWHFTGHSGGPGFSVQVGDIQIINREDGQVESTPTPATTIVRQNGSTPGIQPGLGLRPKHITYADPNTGWAPYLKNRPSRINTPIQPNEENKRKPIVVEVPDVAIKIRRPEQPPIIIDKSEQTGASNTRTIKVEPPKIQFDPAGNPEPVRITVEPPTIVYDPEKTEEPIKKQQPTVLISPGTGTIIFEVAGQKPFTIDPTLKQKPTDLKPTEGKNNYVPLPLLDPGVIFDQDKDKDKSDFTTPSTDTLPEIFAGIIPILTIIQNQTKPQAIRDAAAAGTCQTTQPGGCTSNAMNAAIKKGNDDLIGKLNAGGQAVDLALLGVINNKLGPQMPGGLSSGLGRMSRFLGIDRLFNLLNFLVLLHNASMLSGSLKVTLLETLSSLGNATGLLQTSENDNVDLNQVFNQGIEKFIVSLIGVEAWASLKLTWRKYNPIYRAMNNGLSHIGNMFSSIGNGIEVIGERTGKIGNAIRSAGVVRDNAYNHMSERMNVHTSKFMTFQTTVNGVTEVLEAINEVAESTIEGQESYAEAVKATAEFKKLLNESDKNTPSADVENKAIKAEAEKIKENLVKDPTGEDEEGLLSFLTDL